MEIFKRVLLILEFTCVIGEVVFENSALKSALHARNLRKLIKIQSTLSVTLEQLNSSILQPECKKGVQAFLKSVKEDALTVSKSVKSPNIGLVEKAILEHPVLSLRITKNIVDLTEKTIPHCERSLSDTTLSLFSRNGVTVPTSATYEHGLMKLLYLQYVYGLNASDIQRGVFGGHHTGVHLKLRERLDLAKSAMKMKANVLAYQWLSAAADFEGKLTIIEDSTSETDLLFTKLAKSERKQVDRIHFSLNKKRQKKIKGFPDYDSFKGCRGQVKLETCSRLNCYYGGDKQDPYHVISPLKVEILSKIPVIYQCYDLLTAKTTKRLQSLINGDNLVPRNKKDRDLLGWIKEKMKQVMEMEVKLSHKANVVEFGVFAGNKQQNVSSLEEEFATFSLFLSDVHVGGYTVFKDANVYVRAVRGSGLFWHNTYMEIWSDAPTIKSECPVVVGHKIVASWQVIDTELQFEELSIMSSIKDWYA